MKAKFVLKGGPGSGHHGHAGIPGKQGGSLPGGIDVASVINFGYESGGDLDEALRLHSESVAGELGSGGVGVEPTPEEYAKLKRMFDNEFKKDKKRARNAQADIEEASRKRDAEGVLEASRAIDEIADSLSMKKTSSIDGGKSVIYQTRAKFSDIKKVLTNAGWTRLSDAGINTFTLDVKGRTLFAEAKRNGNRYDIQIDSYDE